jgi:hypothetical protein
MRASCGALVRTVSHQGLRTVALLVRALLIDLADTTIEAAALGGLLFWEGTGQPPQQGDRDRKALSDHPRNSSPSSDHDS